MHFFARRAIWYARQAVANLGWVGALAAGLFAISAAFGFFVLRPMQSQIRELKQEVVLLRAQAKARLPSEQKTRSPAEQLASFYSFFPMQDTMSDSMAKLYSAAAQQNLTLEQGEYRLAQEQDGKLARYDIELPVKGGYVQVRKFIAQAMAEVPSLSLDGITFSRQKIGDTLVDAQIHFTLFLAKNDGKP